MKPVGLLFLVAAGCVPLPPIAHPCDRGGPVERSGCESGFRDALLRAPELQRVPVGERADEWLSGYLLGRAESKLQSDRVSGRHMMYSGIVMMVLSAFSVAAMTASLFRLSGVGYGYYALLYAGPNAAVETAIGLPLFFAGLHRELSGERGLVELGANPPPGGGATLRF